MEAQPRDESPCLSCSFLVECDHCRQYTLSQPWYTIQYVSQMPSLELNVHVDVSPTSHAHFCGIACMRAARLYSPPTRWIDTGTQHADKVNANEANAAEADAFAMMLPPAPPASDSDAMECDYATD
jgi:hypothetical protein